MWKWSMYYRGSDISHEYLFLNGNVAFKALNFPMAFRWSVSLPIGKNKMLCFELAQPKLKYFGLSN